MRVLHVITGLSGGGAEGVVAALVPALAREGARCGVMSIYPTIIPPVIAGARGVDVLEVRRRGRYDASFLGRMIAQMREWRPDIVHTHMFVGSYWGRLAAIAAGVPVIVRTEHMPCSQKRIPGALLGSKLLNVATAAIVTFFPEQGRVLRTRESFPENKLAVIPNGIHHADRPQDDDVRWARNHLGLSRDTYAIFVLGSLYGPKNQALALSSFAALHSEYRRRAHMFILGDGRDRSRLEALAGDLGLQEHLSFLGYRSDARQLLPAADLLLMPSLTEGMPLAMLEAMSAGVPVLSTPWPGVKDMLQFGALGTIAADYDPTTIAGSLRGLMEQERAARAVARLAQDVARTEYTLTRTATMHRILYETLTHKRRAA